MVHKVIKFYATWCGPCKVYAKTFDKVAEEYRDSVIFSSLNVEKEGKELAKKYNIQAIPTTVFIREGQPDEVVPGNIPLNDLKDKIDA